MNRSDAKESLRLSAYIPKPKHIVYRKRSMDLEDLNKKAAKVFMANTEEINTFISESFKFRVL